MKAHLTKTHKQQDASEKKCCVLSSGTIADLLPGQMDCEKKRLHSHTKKVRENSGHEEKPPIFFFCSNICACNLKKTDFMFVALLLIETTTNKKHMPS